MWVQFLGQEDTTQKEMATRSIILAWRIPGTDEPGRLQSKGPQRAGHRWARTHASSTSLAEIPILASASGEPDAGDLVINSTQNLLVTISLKRWEKLNKVQGMTQSSCVTKTQADLSHQGKRVGTTRRLSCWPLFFITCSLRFYFALLLFILRKTRASTPWIKDTDQR